MYKIGKSDGVKERMATYNTGGADEIQPVYITEVLSDITTVENCIKSSCRPIQYRKRKEIYRIKLDALKLIIQNCINNLTIVRTQSRPIYIGRLNKAEDYEDMTHELYIMLTKYKDHPNKSKSKSKSKKNHKSSITNNSLDKIKRNIKRVDKKKD